MFSGIWRRPITFKLTFWLYYAILWLYLFSFSSAVLSWWHFRREKFWMMILGRKMDSSKFTKSACEVFNFWELQRCSVLHQLCFWHGGLIGSNLQEKISWNHCAPFWLRLALKLLGHMGSEYQNAVEMMTSILVCKFQIPGANKTAYGTVPVSVLESCHPADSGIRKIRVGAQR